MILLDKNLTLHNIISLISPYAICDQIQYIHPFTVEARLSIAVFVISKSLSHISLVVSLCQFLVFPPQRSLA